MRWTVLLVLSIAAVACTEHGKGGGVFCSFNGQVHQIGDQFPAGDNCNFCECALDNSGTFGQVSCTANVCGDGGLPDGASACAASGMCLDGPACGATCCGFGEQCLNGVCSCGGNASCTNGDSCQTGGPVGGGFCGSICCGSAAHPCPI